MPNICHQHIQQWQSIIIFFSCLQASEVINKFFFAIRTAVTSDFNARATDTVELRWKVVLPFLYCITNSIIELLLYDKSIDVCIFARFKVDCEVKPLRTFPNFKFVMSHYRKFRGAFGHGLCVNPSLRTAFLKKRGARRSPPLISTPTCTFGCVITNIDKRCMKRHTVK